MGVARAQLDERVAAGRALGALLQFVLVVELDADRLAHRAGRNVKLFHHSGFKKKINFLLKKKVKMRLTYHSGDLVGVESRLGAALAAVEAVRGEHLAPKHRHQQHVGVLFEVPAHEHLELQVRRQRQRQSPDAHHCRHSAPRRLLQNQKFRKQINSF
jgi:hypothetical protein